MNANKLSTETTIQTKGPKLYVKLARKPSLSRRQFIKTIAMTSLALPILGSSRAGFATNSRPAIFYTPHQDDEAIGMAGAIREHKQAGRPVYLVLLTNGISRTLLDILNGTIWCPWHGTYHKYKLTMEQMMWARKSELIASAKKLDVDKLFIVDDGQGIDDMMAYRDYDGFISRIVETVKHFESIYPGASHKLVSGALDTLEDGTTNPTHQACWDAGFLLQDVTSDLAFYRVYVYFKGVEDRTAMHRLSLTPAWQAAKRAALSEYKKFNPSAGRYAIGYHSVPRLLDSAYSATTEYYDTIF